MSTRLSISLSALLIASTAFAQPAAKPADKVTPAKIQPAPKSDAKKEVTLKVGDKAPALVVNKWVKGQPVKAFEKGKVYAVEFWATWCGPCRASIPHVTELQKKYKDAVIMGIAASEHPGKDGDKRLEVLTKFVNEKGSEMDYRVGYDADRKMGDPWMKAAGQDGIPCAFIVAGDGKISWIGHPMEMEEPLAAALKDSGKTKSSKTEDALKGKHSTKSTDKTTDKDHGK